MYNFKIVIISTLCFFTFLSGSKAQQNSALPLQIVVESGNKAGDFEIASPEGCASICFDDDEFAGVIRAIGDLKSDIEAVTSYSPEIIPVNSASAHLIVIGTIGKSKLIQQYVDEGLITIDNLVGKWESFQITTIRNPKPGIENCLVIAGSDMRGTIYGIYELSQQLGVSPWYWWADVPVKKRTSAYVLQGNYLSAEPKVRYRGIFINDENPCMQSWAREKFGGMNSEMYAHVFELMLRLRANLLWPGMWGSFKEHNPLVPILKNEDGSYEGNSFNEDDPENPRLANEYGIIIGTSHHEPMQRSQQEWLRNKSNYGNGEWNYMTNKKGIQQFFREGIEHTKDFEHLITIGMRGDDDKPMVDAGSAARNLKILSGIIQDQRKIIEKVTGKPAKETPQIWTLYSEVLDYYDQGINVPDDVIILLCDDNWGNVRRLPELDQERHPGGYGMYYHVCYYGAPRASKWMNVSHINQIWEQLNLTYDYGVDKVWILNVGDIKPMEYSIDFFLNMAWNPEAFNESNLTQYLENYCSIQFGEKQAVEIANILNTYGKYAARITPEMLNHQTYQLADGEFKMVKDEFLALEALAYREYLKVSDNQRDVYKQLVLFPVQAMANLYELYYSLAMNKKLSLEKDVRANFWANQVVSCFKRDSLLCYDYNNNIAEGKWKHMMDQAHIGYSSWHGPQFNIMPEVSYVAKDEARNGGYVFTEKNNVVVIEAEHYFSKVSNPSVQWTIIPDLGRTLSGIKTMPDTVSPKGSALNYSFKLSSNPDSIFVRFYFDSTMPFKKGGHHVAASIIEGNEEVWNINEELTWANCYTKMYPTGAAHQIESVIKFKLPESNDGIYTLTIKPLDPGIIIEKIIVDTGGYYPSFLNMTESQYEKQLID